MKHSLLALLLSATAPVWLTACKKSEPAGEAGHTPSPTSVSSATAGTGAGTVLKVKWPVGTKFTYRMDQALETAIPMPGLPKPMNQGITIGQTYALVVLKESPNGGRQLELEYVAQEIDMKMGEQVITSFDSKSGSESDQNHPLRKLSGAKVRINLDAAGEVESVEGMDELRAKVGGSSTPEMQAIAQQMLSESTVRQFVSLSQGFPDKPVKVGESWPFNREVPVEPLGKITIKATMKFTGMEVRENRQCAALQYYGTMSASSGSVAMIGKLSMDKGTLSGTTWFDPELEAVVESVSDQDMKMKMELRGIPGARANGVTMGTTQKVTLKLVEVAKL